MIEPKTKVCSKCKKRRKIALFRFVSGYRLKSCNVCRNAQMKIYRAEKPEMYLRIQRKSVAKNKDKYNAVRRERYKTDPDYKKKIIAAEKKYKATGRRYELWHINAKKNRAMTARWQKANPDKVRKKARKYREEVQIHKEREEREKLADNYVAAVLKKQLNYAIKTKDIPPEVIEAKRNIIIIKRKTKQHGNKQTGKETGKD